jgi:hypothetical protein
MLVLAALEKLFITAAPLILIASAPATCRHLQLALEMKDEELQALKLVEQRARCGETRVVHHVHVRGVAAHAGSRPSYQYPLCIAVLQLLARVCALLLYSSVSPLSPS